MTYNPNVPDLPNLISNDIPAMLTNSKQLNIIFAVDHVPFNPSVTTSGWHKQVRFPATIATPVLAAGQGAVYTKTIAGRTELFYTSSSAETQITSDSGSGGLPIWKGGTPGTNGVVTANLATNGKMILPNGLQLKWGTITAAPIPIVDNQFFFYPNGPNVATEPFTTATYAVYIQPISNNTSVQNIYLISTGGSDFNKDGFKLRTNTTWPQGFMYFAIGN